MARLTQKYNLRVINPSLVKEWHSIRNGALTPKIVAPHSAKKVWWICSKGHEWKTSVHNRNAGTGCPYCSGRLATSEHNLQVITPYLANEWHPTKNGTLTPRDVRPKSNKRVWWICNRGHEWKAYIYHRTEGKECPYCGRGRLSKGNSLQEASPDLAKQWHPVKNEGLTPSDVTARCSRGHEWEATVGRRENGSGCPYCAGQKVCSDNCLETVNPALAKEWHPIKNTSLTPRDVVPASHKKVWWVCSKGHEWQTRVASRNTGSGCPYCSGHRLCEDNCLQTVNPTLAKEWHPTRNGGLTPRDVMPGSGKKVWWICSKGHEWEASLNSRSSGRGCPYCARERRFNG